MHTGSTKKIWHLAQYDREKAAALADTLGICTNTASLLCVRGIDTPEAAVHFLKKESCSFYNPFLLKDMDKAVERLTKAIRSGEHICVYGDYDVDGITATSLMCLYLSDKGLQCSHYIPKRNSEGYGMNLTAVENIAKSGVSLVVTVDTGVTAVEEIERGKELGLDFIVTDHHECKDIIPDTVVVNPCRRDCNYPYKHLAGVGVVFKVICAVEMSLCGKTDEIPVALLKELLEKYAQLVALGTVADVMPATDENRLIISIGLSMMQNSPAPWFSSILDYSGANGQKKDKKPISTATIGYTIAPRINAAGRIGDAEVAVNLFLTKSKAEADAYAVELCELNKKRQQMENDILQEAEAMLKDEPDMPFIVLASDNWHQGIIGIVASRISEKYCRPCILITFCDEKTLNGKGSGRSVHGVNIYEALESCKDILIKYGGHELAAGLTLDRKNLAEFKRRINEYTANAVKNSLTETTVEIDREPDTYEISLSAAKELRLLEPFGYGNPSPVFLISDAVITDIVSMGNDKHCRFILTKDGCSFQSVYFSVPLPELPFCAGDTVDAVFSMEVNNYNGSERLQLIIKDMRPGRMLQEAICSQEVLYGRITSHTPVTAEELDQAIPTRDDFKNVYLHIMRMEKSGIKKLDTRYTARHISALCGTDIGICKFRIILDIFKEKGLISFEDKGSFVLELTGTDAPAPGEKINLDDSQILCTLRELKRGV